MRILIVGGGVAGLTLAALLGQRGEEPTVVEKVEESGRTGYVVTLWPMGDRMLRGLGLTEGFRELGTPLERTEMRDGRGRLLRTIDWGTLIDRHGETRKLERADLLDLLRSHGGGAPIRTGLTVERIEQDVAMARATLSDGSEEEFDLVVGADGFRSGAAGSFSARWPRGPPASSCSGGGRTGVKFPPERSPSTLASGASWACTRPRRGYPALPYSPKRKPDHTAAAIRPR